MKKRIAALSALPAWLLWACVGIVIGILVVVVGTIIIAKLYYCIKVVLPDNIQTNTIGETFYYQRSSAAITTPLFSPTTIVAPQISGGFPLQYGVTTSNGLPWICAGTNLSCASTNFGFIGVIYTFENDSNCVDLVIATGGTLNRTTWTATNDWMTNYPVNVGIQSSSNLVNWTTIYVDAGCVPDAVANFTDKNTQSPSNFYRVFYQ